VEIWWFDGERDAARQSFIDRGTVGVECMAVQMVDIQQELLAIKSSVQRASVSSIKWRPGHSLEAGNSI